MAVVDHGALMYRQTTAHMLIGFAGQCSKGLGNIRAGHDTGVVPFILSTAGACAKWTNLGIIARRAVDRQLYSLIIGKSPISGIPMPLPGTLPQVQTG